MFLRVNKGRDPHYYVMQTYRKEGGTTTKVHLNLGTASEIREKCGCDDAEAWAKAKVKEINEDLKNEKKAVMIPFHPDKEITGGNWEAVHCGHLVLLPLYNKFKLKQFSDEVKKRHRFKFDFGDILCKLVMSRVLFPDSKRATREELREFVDAPDFSLDDIYNFLSVLAKEITPLQQALYNATAKELSRRTGVIYYDCTNYYFEIDKEDQLRRYGKSKEHRPNPIVQMGMFMDADGLPLAFCINPGNTSEQVTMKPLEEIMAAKFGLSEFVVCTDAGLASIENRRYNTTEGRNYIVTQSIPGLPERLKEWALEKKGWRLMGDKEDRTFDISELDLAKEAREKHLYYRDQWFKETRSDIKDYEERLIVTFSPQYAIYQRQLRALHLVKAQMMAEKKSAKSRQTQQDPRRFLEAFHYTEHGEVAEKEELVVNMSLADKEAEMDGLYCLATRLEDSVGQILHVNGFRYEIEHLFRITKSEFDARPVYLRREDRIKAHFAICFVALLLLKAFQMEVNKHVSEDKKASTEMIINALAKMDYLKIRGHGYVPAYNPSELRTRCCRVAGVNINTELVPLKKMRAYMKS